MKTALVTGGAGLIGSHLVKALLKEGKKVIVADDLSRGVEKNIGNLGIEHEIVDLTRQALCESVFATHRINEVYHLAAFLGGVEFIQKYLVEAYERNMRMNMNVLECCMIYEVDKVLFTSTACVYPVHRQLAPDSPPLKEEDVEPLEPESGYGWAKLMTEYLCGSYIQEYGMKIGMVRMFNVYGPGEAYDDGSHAVPMLCRKAINYPREPFIVWGDGTQTRSFIYVEDAVAGILAVMKNGINKGPYNIGTPDRVSISKLAETIVDLAADKYNKEIPIIYDVTKPKGVIGRSADCQRAYEELSWQPETSLVEGLGKTMDWIELDIREKAEKAHVKSVL